MQRKMVFSIWKHQVSEITKAGVEVDHSFSVTYLISAYPSDHTNYSLTNTSTTHSLHPPKLRMP